MEVDKLRIERLQENLSAIRKVAGWTTERLGEEVGVTRQTISNLEKGKTPMTKTQYLAFRTVFNHEIVSNQNKMLANVILALVDDPVEDEISESDEKGAEALAAQDDTIASLSGVTKACAKADKESLAKLRKAIVDGLVTVGTKNPQVLAAAITQLVMALRK